MPQPLGTFSQAKQFFASKHRVVQVTSSVRSCFRKPSLGFANGPGMMNSTLPDELQRTGGFIPEETLVQNGTAGDGGAAGGTSNQPVLGFLVG